MASLTVFLIISAAFNLMLIGLVIVALKVVLPYIFTKEMEKRANEFRERADLHRGGGVVFLGDSITAGFPVEEFFKEHYVINRGINGDTISGLLGRLEKGLFALKPSKIFILIGTNDLGEGQIPDQILSQYDVLLKKISEGLPETTIYVEAVLPTHPKIKALGAKLMVKNRPNSDIRQINKALPAICEKYSCTFIDTVPGMSDDSGKLKLEFTQEGLHLTTDGYRALTSVIQPYILD